MKILVKTGEKRYWGDNHSNNSFYMWLIIHYNNWPHVHICTLVRSTGHE